MKKIFKYKKPILIVFSIFFCFVFFITMFVYNHGINKNTNFNFTIKYDKVRFFKGDIYIFNKNKLTRESKGKKLEKEIPIYKKIEMNDNIIYALFENSLVMYNKNFEVIKEINLEDKAKDFFIENGKIIVISENKFIIFDETLNEIFRKEDCLATVYVKFSKDNSNFIYTDYKEYDNAFKSRFHILNLKSKKTSYDFTFYNEFIIDMGFVNDSNENLYVLTNEKLYLFEENTIKNQIFVKNLKDISYNNGKIYILSDSLQVYETKNLKLEKELKLNSNNNNIYILKNKILLTGNTGYSLIDRKNYTIEDFSLDILDTVKCKDEVYLILQNKYKKLK